MQAQAAVGDRWARAVAHELFESTRRAAAAFGSDREPRMQVEAVDVRLQRSQRTRSPTGRSRSSEARKRCARSRTQRLKLRDRAAVARSQDWVTVRDAIRPVDLVAEPILPAEMIQHTTPYSAE